MTRGGRMNSYARVCSCVWFSPVHYSLPPKPNLSDLPRRSFHSASPRSRRRETTCTRSSRRLSSTCSRRPGSSQHCWRRRSRWVKDLLLQPQLHHSQYAYYNLMKVLSFRPSGLGDFSFIFFPPDPTPSPRIRAGYSVSVHSSTPPDTPRYPPTPPDTPRHPQALGEALEMKEAQLAEVLTAANLDPGTLAAINQRLEEVLDNKNQVGGGRG